MHLMMNTETAMGLQQEDQRPCRSGEPRLREARAAAARDGDAR
jgi:hypothetical protein